MRTRHVSGMVAGLMAVMVAFVPFSLPQRGLSAAWTGSVLAGDEADRARLEKEIHELQKGAQAFTQLFTKVVELVMPSVVSISTEQVIKRPVRPWGSEEWPFMLPSPFRRDPRWRAPQEEEREFRRGGLGSGVVVDPRGYILTNYHVLKDVKAEDVKVTFSDGRQFVAEKVTTDEKTDLAVVKIGGGPFRAARFGRSEDLKPGEWVIAIGSPLGWGGTVTSGIVSATTTKNRLFVRGRRDSLRAIRKDYAIENYIQTDAAINPGNSGGPLVNLKGEVVGINTLIFSASGTSAGLGFAVPTQIAGPVMRQLIDKGKVTRGYLGVAIEEPGNLTDEQAQKALGMTADELREKYQVKKTDKGVLVLEVMPETPAEAAGVKIGDLIVEFAGKKTRTMYELRTTVAGTRPGRKVKVNVVRRGKPTILALTVGEQPEEAPLLAMGEQSITAEELGLRVQSIPAQFRRRPEFRDVEGVIVTDVIKGSPADRAGIKRYDIIMGVGLKPVKTPREFEQEVKKAGKEGVALLVKRGDTTELVSVTP